MGLSLPQALTDFENISFAKVFPISTNLTHDFPALSKDLMSYRIRRRNHLTVPNYWNNNTRVSCDIDWDWHASKGIFKKELSKGENISEIYTSTPKVSGVHHWFYFGYLNASINGRFMMQMTTRDRRLNECGAGER